MKKGMSIIALVITIIVAIIISGTVVVMLTDMSPITKARKVSFQDKLSKYNEQLNLYKTSNVNEKISDSKNENLEKYISNISNVDYNLVAIENEKLVYTGRKEKERQWAAEINILTSRNSSPTLSDTYIVSEGKTTPIPIKQYGEPSANLYFTEESWDPNVKGGKLIKYNNKNKKMFKTKNITPSSVNLQGKYLYASSYSKLYKIEDETGNILLEKDLEKDYFRTHAIVTDKIYMYSVTEENSVELNTLDKDTLEKIDTKEIIKASEVTPTVYIENNEVFIYSINKDNLLKIYKMSGDNISWDISLTGILLEDSISLYDNSLYVPLFNLKTYKKELFNINTKTGKVAKTDVIDLDILKVYNIDKNNSMLCLFKQDDINYIGKLDSTFKELWKFEVGKESDSIMIVSMSEKDNMLVVANYIALDAHDDGTITFRTKIRNYIYE